MNADEGRWISVDLATQTLTLFDAGQPIRHWPISTALNGAGERMDSGCTPRGEHRVRLLIGDQCPENTVFVARRPTGECYSTQLAEQHPDRDWILSRVIWLTGAEPGRNRGGDCDTLRRFIYIHGCPDCEPMGLPVSHGCIRMRNADVIELFGMIRQGTRVVIVERAGAVDAPPA